MPTAPAASRANEKKHSELVHYRFWPDQSGFPRANGFNGFLRALPGEPGFIATIIGAMRKHRRQLDTSVGVSGPHDFAVRFPRASSWRAENVHRIPRPTFVTTAKRPSLRSAGRDGICW